MPTSREKLIKPSTVVAMNVGMAIRNIKSEMITGRRNDNIARHLLFCTRCGMQRLWRSSQDNNLNPRKQYGWALNRNVEISKEWLGCGTYYVWSGRSYLVMHICVLPAGSQWKKRIEVSAFLSRCTAVGDILGLRIVKRTWYPSHSFVQWGSGDKTSGY